MTLYIDGLSKTIKNIVTSHREIIQRPGLTFEDLIHFPRSEDEAVCARKL